MRSKDERCNSVDHNYSTLREEQSNDGNEMSRKNKRKEEKKREKKKREEKRREKREEKVREEKRRRRG